MATISAYRTKRGTRYRVRYRTPDNRQTDKRGFKTRRAATDFLNSVEVSKLKGEFIEARRARATIDDLGPDWLAQKVDIKVSTRAALESCWQVHVRPKWGKWTISTIEQSHVRTWIADLASSGLSATTVKRAHGVLAGILDEAVRDRRILSNPCRGVKTPRKVSKQKTFLSHEQLHALANASGEHRAMVLLMGYTGLRWGEVIALRVRDLNLIRRRISIAENAVEVGSHIHIGTPKTHEQRSVAFPEFLSILLLKQAADKLPDALLFPGSDGLHLRRTRTDANGKGWFAQAVRKAGVPRITPHELRHTAASLAISAGANVKAVQAMLGHKSAAMTLDTYSGLFPDDLDAVADAMGRAGASFMRA